MMDPMEGEKRRLRDRLRGQAFADLLASVDSDSAGKRALEWLMLTNEWKEADSVFSYVSVSGELSTQALNEAVFFAGKKLALPRVGVSGQMDFFKMDNRRPLSEQLVPNKWKILEPEGKPVELARPRDFARALFIVPGVAFGEKLERLGRGGGFYDRYLGDIEPPPVCAGWCFQEQVIEKIPIGPNDVRMTLVVTPNGVIKN